MKGKKKIIIIAICLFILAGAGIFLYFNPDMIPAFNNNDPGKETGTASKPPDASNTASPPSTNQGQLNDKVKLLDKKQSGDIQSKITYIDYSEAGNLVLTFGGSLPDDLKHLRKDTVLFIPAVTGGVLPETYIGKVENIVSGDGNVKVELSIPGIDEVFDKLQLDIDSTLTKSNFVSADLQPGVTISYEKKDFDSMAQNVSLENGAGVQTMVYGEGRTGKPQLLETAADDNKPLSIKLNIEDLDLMKLFNSMKVMDKKPVDKLPEGYEGDNNLTLMLNGEIGFENIQVYQKVDFDIKQKWLFKDFAIGASGDFVSRLRVDANFLNMDLGDIFRQGRGGFDPKTDNDKFTLDYKFLEIEGLKENTFPIANLMWHVGTVPIMKPGEISSTDMIAPLTIGVVVSVDIEGNLTMKAYAEIAMQKRLDTGKIEIIKDGQVVFTNGGAVNPEPTAKNGWKIGVEASADVDFQLLNFNIGAYIFNLNVTRLTATGIGTEVAGKAKIAVDDKGIADNGTELSGYLSIYSKLLLKINIAAKTKLFFNQLYTKDAVTTASQQVESGSIMWCKLDFTWELFRYNYFELGEQPTDYDPDKMGYNQISAYDDTSIYYKDISGYLTRISKNDGSNRTTILAENFFIIVGIDKTYIYVLKASAEGGGYDLYRVRKDGSTFRMISQKVANCIMQDSNYLFIIPLDEQNKCKRLNKKTLITTDFASLENKSEKIQSLFNRNDNEYLLVSMEESMFSFLSGPDVYYNSVSKTDGTITRIPREYQNYLRDKFESYSALNNITSTGFLRNIAQEVFWESKDGTVHKSITGISGWNPKEEGLFIQLDNTDEATRSEYPYVIARCRPEDGEIENVWKTASKQSFFTLQKYNGIWYFIDQTPAEFILYSADSLGGEPRIIESAPANSFNTGLDKCSTAIIEGKLFFFTIIDNSSKLLYRYDIKK